MLWVILEDSLPHLGVCWLASTFLYDLRAESAASLPLNHPLRNMYAGPSDRRARLSINTNLGPAGGKSSNKPTPIEYYGPPSTDRKYPTSSRASSIPSRSNNLHSPHYSKFPDGLNSHSPSQYPPSPNSAMPLHSDPHYPPPAQGGQTLRGPPSSPGHSNITRSNTLRSAFRVVNDNDGSNENGLSNARYSASNAPPLPTPMEPALRRGRSSLEYPSIPPPSYDDNDSSVHGDYREVQPVTMFDNNPRRPEKQAFAM